jgi:hypothetical protein
VPASRPRTVVGQAALESLPGNIGTNDVRAACSRGRRVFVSVLCRRDRACAALCALWVGAHRAARVGPARWPQVADVLAALAATLALTAEAGGPRFDEAKVSLG